MKPGLVSGAWLPQAGEVSPNMDKIGVLPAQRHEPPMSLALPRSPASGLPLLPADLSARQRGALGAVVVVAHGLMAWLLWHTASPTPAMVEPPVITAMLVMDSPRPVTERALPPMPLDPVPTPSRVMPRPPVVPAKTALAPAQTPVLASARPAPGAEVPVVPPVQESKPAAQAAPVSPAPVATAAAHAPLSPAPAAEPPRPVSASPRELPMSAVRYLVEPPQVYPRASRDLGESGVVLLKVLVDEEGRPKDVLVSKGSGFPRLDRQAVLNMKAARFQPHVESGVPRAVWVPAEIVFNLE